MSKNRTIFYGAVFVGLAAGTLYFLTAARDLIVGDSPELITAAATLGVPHAPGYPLFTILGHLFSLLPFGPIPFRVNLLSVLCDALTVSIVFLIAFQLTQSAVSAAIASFLLAVDRIFWSWSVTAEVFPLNNLLAALLVYFLINWHERPERRQQLIASSFVAGLGLANHQTIVLLAPACAFILWQRRRFLQPHLIGVCAAAFCAGLLPYIYIPWASARHPVYNWGDVSSLKEMFALISRSDYGTLRLVGDPKTEGGSALARIVALISSFRWVTGPLSILGAFEAYRQKRWFFWFTIIAFAFAGPVFAAISNVNLATAPAALSVFQRFFLLPHVVVAPLAAFGVLLILKLAHRNVPAFLGLPIRSVLAISAAGFVAFISLNYREIDQSHNSMARHFAEDAFASTEPGSILLIAGDAIAFPLIYLQAVEHTGNQIPLIGTHLLALPWYLRELRQTYPNLVVPFSKYDQQEHNLKMLLDANPRRRIFAIGPVTGDDQSLNDSYLTYPHGVLVLLAPRTRNISSEENIPAENNKLLSRYHVPPFTTVHKSTLESDIIRIYAWPAFRIADSYARNGLTAEARSWYQRALAIDPDLSQAKEGLRRISQE